MRTLRIIGEIALLLGVCWLSVASSDDEGDSGGGGSSEPSEPAQPGDPAKACEQDTECAGFQPADKCAGQERCLGGLCVWQQAVTCAGGEGTCVSKACDPATGTCLATPQADGAYCDDANACTTGDQCKAGQCVPGTTQVCDDGNACTNDSCDKTLGCQYQAKAEGTPCASTNKCYQDAKCDVYGSCAQGAQKDCDDGNACTQDWCDESSGCVNQIVANGGCDDGDACTINDTCSTGTCKGTPAADGDLCEDGNPCTGGTVCQGGACGGGMPVGDQGACDDGDPCTEGTICGEGVCGGGVPVTCPDDGNPCSSETCDSTTGCTVVPAPEGTECPSSNPCWEKALCQGTECLQGIPVPNGTACDDGQPCTGGSVCQGGECVAGTPLGDGAKCDDGNACTANEICTSGWCSSTQELSCDDFNPCTTDWCDTAIGCVHDPVGDGTLCTVTSGCLQATSCKAGVCVGADACDDGDACTVDSCGGGNVCSSAWQQAACPAESACANGKDDDDDGQADCAQPGCPKLAGAICGEALPLPAMVDFEAGPGPGFGAWAHATGKGAYTFAVDGTPTSVTPWSGAATLNFNDGTQAGFPQGATELRSRARLCCFDGQSDGETIYVTWMEYVDLPGPEEGAQPVRGFRVTRTDGQPNIDMGLTTVVQDRGVWRRRVAPVSAGVPLASFGLEWWIGDAPAAWSGGTGWFIDDVEVAREENCTNGVDDNGNGKIDCADPVCDLYDGCQEWLCADGQDDNEDGFVDCDDQDCAFSPDCQ